MKATVAGRTAAGERLKDICATPGWPSVACVGRWARADPAFRAALERARFPQGRPLSRAERRAMRATRRRCPSQAREEILARVAAGETVRAVCASPGMPSKATVGNWRSADPGFAAALEEARRVGDWRRREMFDPVRGEAILAGLRAGERIVDILARPGMPSWRTYRYWRMMQAPFAEAVWRLKNASLAARGRLGNAARFRSWDEAAADAVYLAVLRGAPVGRLRAERPDLPGLTVITRWRKERPGFDRMMRFAIRAGRMSPRRAAPGLTPELFDDIWTHILEGGTLRSYARRPGAPGEATLGRWVQMDPAFAAMVRQACADREHWYLEQMEEIAEAASPETVKAAEAAIAPLKAKLGWLRNRPGRGTWAKRPLRLLEPDPEAAHDGPWWDEIPREEGPRWDKG